jgi:hypothetical protein
MQRPSTLDTAYALALLQEEVAESATKSEFHAFERGASHKHQFRQALPKQPPQVGADKPLVKATPQASDDKLSALRNYRRARGLCDFCAEKWFKGHKCAPTILLHAMQEVWDLLQLEAMPDPSVEMTDTPDTSPEHLFLALSHAAQMGSQGRKTIQFRGSISGIPVTVLVDSGSSASFLAASVAAQLPHLHRSPVQASVKIANGQVLQCSAAILGCQFSLGEHSFQHDLRILPLDSYDLILGMDWLELYSPMEVHWHAK